MAVMLELTVGGDVKQVQKLPFSRNKDFKKKLMAVANEVMPQINEMGTVPADLDKNEVMMAYLETMLTSIDGLLEKALGLVIDYASGVLPKTVEDEIVDEEIIDAFLCVVNAAVPLKKLKVLAAGFSSIG